MSCKTTTTRKRLVHYSPAFAFVVIASTWILSLLISTSGFILASSDHAIERGFKRPFDDAIDNATASNLEIKRSIGKPVSKENAVRDLSSSAHYSVTAQSLTQELYGIIDFQEATIATFQEVYDEYVESYFSLKVDRLLAVDSKITVTNVLIPSVGDRHMRRQRRNLEFFQNLERRQHEGSSVIITYDQQLSYYFPNDGGMLTLETLVTLPFLTETGRNEFNLKLIDSDDSVLKNVIGVSEVDLPPQSPTTQPITVPTQLPPAPVSEPQPSTIKPVKSPTQKPTRLATASPSSRPQSKTSQPTRSDVKIPAPSSPPTVAPTARPTLIRSKVSPAENNDDSGGISGLIVLFSLMAVLFIIFAINMKYCMGEYVD